MKAAILLIPVIPWLVLLASCSSPPKPPTVDESRKRPANSAVSIELQTCRGELENTRLRAHELRRLAEASAAAAAATAALVAAHDARSSEAMTPRDLAPLTRTLSAFNAQPESAVRANGVFTVRFEYGSTRIDLSPDAARTLIDEAKAAPLILLRGRTDGQADAPAESHIARARAAAVADYLVAAGVSPSRIRATHQPVGDHVAENRSTQGRTLNRRVEVEIYRAMPVALNAASPGDNMTP